MIALLLLALALSMDAFAVAIGLGAKHRTHTLKIAIMAGLYFGLAQGIMPLIGYLGGRTVLGFIADYAGWIGCIILVGLGGKMLYEAFKGEGDDEENLPHNIELNLANTEELPIDHKTMFSLAVATSIDAMAAGFTLNLLAVNPYFACIMIAVITGIFSVIGVFLGKQSGTWLESKAEIFGGVVLIGMGIKMLF